MLARRPLQVQAPSGDHERYDDRDDERDPPVGDLGDAWKYEAAHEPTNRQARMGETHQEPAALLGRVRADEHVRARIDGAIAEPNDRDAQEEDHPAGRRGRDCEADYENREEDADGLACWQAIGCASSWHDREQRTEEDHREDAADERRREPEVGTDERRQ